MLKINSRRVVTILLAAMLLIPIAACGNNSTSSHADTTAVQTTTKENNSNSSGSRNRNDNDENGIDGDNSVGNRNLQKISYWPESAPAAATVEKALWEFDIGDINGESILSVSPSGKHILTADRITVDLSKSNTYGVPNPLGKQVDYISVYTLTNGVYSLATQIDIDYDTNPALNNTLAMAYGESIAWSEDETRALIAVGSSAYRYLGGSHTNIYLADFEKQTFENLTGSDDEDQPSVEDGGHINVLPQWIDNNNISFIRYEFVEYDEVTHAQISLMQMNMNTGKQTLLSYLNTDGRVMFIYDYKVLGDSVYFSKGEGPLEASGFFVAKLDGGKTPETCLINVLELIEDNIHPHQRSFFSVQISPDGRWAVLTAIDTRILNCDVPLADDPDFPQPDPSSAKSPVTKRDWIPCHSVMLYDLKNNEIVNPFTAASLHPDVVIATGATFAPDGKSLLCAVLGDGGPWLTDRFFKEATIYQIRLDDGSFDAVRIFKTDLIIPPDSMQLIWLKNDSLLMQSWYGIPPINQVQIVTPAAFERIGN